MKRWTDLSPGMRDVLKLIAVVAIFLALGLIDRTQAAVMITKGDGSVGVRLMQTPCVNPAVLAMIKEPFRSGFQTAEANVRAGRVAGCWILTADENVFLVFETGETISMPPAAFKLEHGA